MFKNTFLIFWLSLQIYHGSCNIHSLIFNSFRFLMITMSVIVFCLSASCWAIPNNPWMDTGDSKFQESHYNESPIAWMTHAYHHLIITNLQTHLCIDRIDHKLQKPPHVACLPIYYILYYIYRDQQVLCEQTKPFNEQILQCKTTSFFFK